MAVISLASDWNNNESRVIIKSPRMDSKNSPQLNIEKLLQESKYLQSTAHRYIVRFLDFYEIKNVPNLVVEYLNGANMRKKFEFAPADERSAVKWACQILDALEYIHGTGHIHRDLNPGNVMVAGNEAKLIDFGTIKQEGYSEYTGFYKEGFNIPEVAAKGWADKRSDIYGVGGTLYYILTCEPPGFRRDKNIITYLTSKGISTRTAGCIDQALQMEPNSRFDTAAAMRIALMGV